jgi:hypothetical protein
MAYGKRAKFMSQCGEMHRHRYEEVTKRWSPGPPPHPRCEVPRPQSRSPALLNGGAASARAPLAFVFEFAAEIGDTDEGVVLST